MLLTLGLLAGVHATASAAPPAAVNPAASQAVVDSYRLEASAATAALLSGRPSSRVEISFDREVVIGAADGAGFRYRAPVAPPVSRGYVVVPAAALQRVRDGGATRVPELDPDVGHSALILLIGAVAVVLGGRRRR